MEKKEDICLIEFLDFKSLIDMQINAMPNDINKSEMKIIVARKYRKFIPKLGNIYRGVIIE